jgi:hypothetical protein
VFCLNVGLFFFLVLGVLVVGGTGFVYMHELVHVANYKQVGIETHLEFQGTSVLTVPESNYKSDADAQTTRLSNAVNEAVGYQVLPIGLMICGTIFISALYVKGGKE